MTKSYQRLAGGLLIDEEFDQFSPTLATKIGISQAIVLQKIHWWVKHNEKNNKNFINEFYWVYNSYPEWVEYFPYWSEHGIRKILIKLRELDLIFAEQISPNKLDKSFYYRINYEAIVKLNESDFIDASDTKGQVRCPKVADASSIKVADVYKETDRTADRTTDRTLDEKAQAPFSSEKNSEKQKPSNENQVENGVSLDDFEDPRPSPKSPLPENDDVTETLKNTMRSKKEKISRRKDNYDIPLDYVEEHLPDYDPEIEAISQRRDFVNHWKFRTEKLGGSFPKVDTKTKTLVKSFFNKFPDDNKLLLEWVDWIFENWQYIKEADTNVFGQHGTPPIATLLSNHFGSQYLTAFKKGANLKQSSGKGQGWQEGNANWETVREKKGKLKVNSKRSRE